MQLKDNILSELKENKEAKRGLEDTWERSVSTIERWINDNDPWLCHLKSLNVISAHLKKEIEDLYTD